jgi:Ca2+-binding RTX toxin-like protein
MGTWSPNAGGATAGNDTFTGNSSDETADGLGGDDTLSGDDGDDTLSGGANNDILDAGFWDFDYDGAAQGVDSLNGGTGDDDLRNLSLFDTADGGDGIDKVSVSLTATVSALGVQQENALGIDVDLADAISGTLVLNVGGVGGQVTLSNVEIFSVIFGSGADRAFGGSNNDFLWGEAYNFSGGDDELHGGGGDDQIYGGAGADQLFGDQGVDALRGGEVSPGADDYAADSLYGGEGDDLLEPNAGDLADGGAGADAVILRLGGSNTSYTFDLTSIPQSGAPLDLGDGTRLVGVESVPFIYMGGGDDNITSGNGGEVVSGGGGNDTIHGGDSADRITGDDGADTLFGDGGADDLSGGEGNDALSGGEGDDTLNGGNGNDTITDAGSVGAISGGANDDLINMGEFTSGFVNGGTDTDTLRFYGSASHSIVGVTLTSIEVLHTGGLTATAAQFEAFDFIRYSSGFGIAPILTLASAAVLDLSDELFESAVSFHGSSGDDTFTCSNWGGDLFGEGGNDTLNGGSSIEYFYGGEGDDTANGAAGDDRFWGSAGADTFNGGADVDWAVYETSSSAVQVRLGGGLTTGGDATGDVLTDMENAVGSGFNDLLIGANGVNNRLEGGFGNDELDGLSGNDTLNGDHGTDVLIGGAGIDTLSGGADNDTLYGGADADVLNGGTQSDTADYTGSSSRVRINLATGVSLDADAQGDTFIEVENLTGSAFNDLLTGNDGANTLIGGAGNDKLVGLGDADVLIGRLGADALDGGDGVDVADYSASASRVRANLAGVGLDADAQGDTYVNVENVTGSAFNDVLTGNGVVNVLVGALGSDVLGGGAGADTLNGGDGADTADYSLSASRVRVNLATGVCLDADAEGDTLVSIEHLIGSGFNDILTGDAGSNVFAGGAGDDVVIGGAGADAHNGGDGADTADYSASASRVRVNLSTGVALDADAQGDSFATMENLIGSAFNDILTGATGTSVLTGGAGNDRLSGLDGDDTLSGGAGTDVLVGGLGADALNGGDGVDTADYSGSASRVRVNLTTGAALDAEAAGDTFVGVEAIIGSAFNDLLTGSAGANTLTGGAGNDQLSGLGGADVLVGNAGNDAFIFGATLGAGNIDAISDFSVVDDIMYLDDAVFAGLTVGALSAGAFQTGASATQADDRIIYNAATGALLFDADGNGAGAAVQFATLSAGLALTNADFLVT